MKHRILIAAAYFVIGAVITAYIHQPFSLFLFRMREPYFKNPIHSASSKITIRNDLMGDGDFGTKRGNGRSHSGIDILTPVGTSVYASKSGTAFAGKVPTGYGNYIMIYHPDGYQTFYGHLKDSIVKPIWQVRQGEIIGYVGKTGNARNRLIRPHLHFEIRKDGEPQDPRTLMK